MTADLTEAEIIALDAFHLIEAYAAKDREHVDQILDLWTGQHDKLARVLAYVTSVMLRSNGTPADVLADYRAYIFNERDGEA
jgi:hypothetical protein